MTKIPKSMDNQKEESDNLGAIMASVNSRKVSANYPLNIVWAECNNHNIKIYFCRAITRVKSLFWRSGVVIE